MKIRITGAPHLVLLWREALEQDYKIKGAIYTQKNTDDLLCQIKIDDHRAAQILQNRPNNSEQSSNAER